MPPKKKEVYSPRKRYGIRPVSEETYKLFIDLLKCEFRTPVNKRTPEQRKAIVQFWRIKKFLTIKVEDGKEVLFCSGKRVLTKKEFEKLVRKTAKKTMGGGARAVKGLIKENCISAGDTGVRNVLHTDKTYSVTNAKFTNKAPLKPILANEIFERIQIDLVDMRKDEVEYGGNTYKYILSAVDCFSRYTFLKPLSTKSPNLVVGALEEIFLEHGYPRILQCDNGSEFKGSLPQYLQKHKVQLIHGSPYHPQSQGKVERGNASLKRKIQYCKFKKRGGNWVQLLKKVANALNNQPKEVLAYQTPYAIYFGRSKTKISVDKMRELALSASRRCAHREQRKYRLCSIYKPGDKILLRYPTRPQRIPKKRNILAGKILKRGRNFSKYFVKFLDPAGNTRQSWVPVANLTSLTAAEEKRRRAEAKIYFARRQERHDHRQRYYITRSPSYSPSPDRTNSPLSHRTDSPSPEREFHEGERIKRGRQRTRNAHLKRCRRSSNDHTSASKEFVPGVKVAYNPTRFGSCQFDALSHQFNSIGLYMTGEQLRARAISHLRENKEFYSLFFRSDVNFDRYIEHMAKRTTYGDNFTLQSIAREFYMQILVVSKQGVGYHRLISNTGKFDPEMPIVTIGHFPEGRGEHYMSVIVSKSIAEYLSDIALLTSTSTANARPSVTRNKSATAGICGNAASLNNKKIPLVQTNDISINTQRLSPTHDTSSSTQREFSLVQNNDSSSTQTNEESSSRTSNPHHDPSHEHSFPISQTQPNTVSPSTHSTDWPYDLPSPHSFMPALTSTPLSTSVEENQVNEEIHRSFDPYRSKGQRRLLQQHTQSKSKERLSPELVRLSHLTSSLSSSHNSSAQPASNMRVPDAVPLVQPMQQAACASASVEDNPVLPNDLLEHIIRQCITLYPESMHRLKRVNTFFLDVVERIGYPKIYINSHIMPEVPNPVCVRRICRNFGRYSGVVIKLRDIIQDRRFMNTWLDLLEREINWYEIRNVFWR